MKPLPDRRKWTATSAISRKKLPDDEIAKVMLVATFKADKYSITAMGKEIESGTYKVDGKKKPAQVDFTIVEGPGQRQIRLAVHQNREGRADRCPR